MADLAEILQMEHLAIRHLKNAFDREFDMEHFQEFGLYLKECHIEIEEKLLFPVLQAYGWDDSTEFNATANRILSDHRLIGTLSDNLLKWYNAGDRDLFARRLPLFFRLLLDHNNSEEENVFPRWLLLPALDLKNAKIEAVNTIESYGKTRYLKITGMSEKSYEYFTLKTE